MNIKCITIYPEDGNITLSLDPAVQTTTSIFLRIPSWSKKTNLKVNGKEITGSITPGSYLQVTREWKKGDSINIQFDMRARVMTLKNGLQQYEAIVRGPVVLARDSRFGNYDIDDELAFDEKRPAYITVERIPFPNVWMAFNYTFSTGGGENPVTMKVPLIDFSSAGNSWRVDDRYRVWIPVGLDVAHAGR
jgi:hypothetical protein